MLYMCIYQSQWQPLFEGNLDTFIIIMVDQINIIMVFVVVGYTLSLEGHQEEARGFFNICLFLPLIFSSLT